MNAAKKLGMLFFICFAASILSILAISNGESGIGKVIAIVFTLAGMVVGFSWFVVLIWTHFFRK
jgi:hypothetical protein